jgi:hypothetical protein
MGGVPGHGDSRRIRPGSDGSEFVLAGIHPVPIEGAPEMSAAGNLKRTALVAAMTLLPGVGVGVALAGQGSAARSPAAKVAKRAVSAPRYEHAAQTFTNCTPVQVMAFAQRIHVRCAAAVGGIRFFALGTANAPNAARILTILTTAQVAGRDLTILFDASDLSGASIGCQTNDCRLILAAGFGR